MDWNEILNGPRDYDHYTRDDAPMTLEELEALARESMFNGPEGNIWVLRLIEAIKELEDRNA